MLELVGTPTGRGLIIDFDDDRRVTRKWLEKGDQFVFRHGDSFR